MGGVISVLQIFSKRQHGKAKASNGADSEDSDLDDTKVIRIEEVRQSDEVVRNAKWVNRQRVLIFASRGITFLHRHLMEDLRRILPHSKSENKREKRGKLSDINEICEMRNSNKCIYLEGKKKEDLYMWMTNVNEGPSMLFLVENIHTMRELKLTGNCLKGSRALLIFNDEFDAAPHLQVTKELLTQIFGTPAFHPKSQPFTDHIITFAVLDKKIWIRNYQILEEKGALAEIGPRFLLNPIKIFAGSFQGQTLWENQSYISPNVLRRRLRSVASVRYKDRVEQRKGHEARKPDVSYPVNEADDVFA